jgi:hypothetical protein
MRAVALILGAALLATPSPSIAEPKPRVELVPSVRHGHSVTWKTGAAITIGSLGVAFLGGALVATAGVSGLEHAGGNEAMMWSGIAICVSGGAGIFIAGPAVWLSGIGGAPDPN